MSPVQTEKQRSRQQQQSGRDRRVSLPLPYSSAKFEYFVSSCNEVLMCQGGKSGGGEEGREVQAEG